MDSSPLPPLLNTHNLDWCFFDNKKDDEKTVQENIHKHGGISDASAEGKLLKI